MPQLWVTYVELADYLDLDHESARTIVHNRKWDRRRSHDGLTRVKLPADEALSYMTAYVSYAAASISNDWRVNLRASYIPSIRNKKVA